MHKRSDLKENTLIVHFCLQEEEEDAQSSRIRETKPQKLHQHVSLPPFPPFSLD